MLPKFNTDNITKIPEELRLLSQWVCFTCFIDENGKLGKEPVELVGRRKASSTDPDTWGTFDEVLHNIRNASTPLLPGFVLTSNDPYVVVDLDDHGNLTNTDTMVRNNVLNTASHKTYVEVSVSGKGLHVILKDKGGAYGTRGLKRHNTEVYSQERMILITGEATAESTDFIAETDAQMLHDWVLNSYVNDVFNGRQLPEHILGINRYAALPQVKRERFLTHLNSIHATYADNQQFNFLMAGDYPSAGYPSGSEADLALMSMVAKVSDDPDVVRTVFMASGLAQRESKRGRERYVTDTLAKVMKPDATPNVMTPRLLNIIHDVASINTFRADPKATSPAAVFADCDEGARERELVHDIIKRIPGKPRQWLSDMVHYMINPTYEMAFVCVMSILSLLLGRMYATPIKFDKMSLFILMTAPTGVGKAEAANTINGIMQKVHGQIRGGVTLYQATEGVSKEGLQRVLSEGTNTAFVTIPEAAAKFGQMVAWRNNTPAQGFMRMLLDVYNAESLAKLSRAKADDSTAAVMRPHVCMLAEGTNDTFDALADPSLVVSGLPSRMLSIPIGRPMELEMKEGRYCSESTLQDFADLAGEANEYYIQAALPGKLQGLPIQVRFADRKWEAKVLDGLRKQTQAAFDNDEVGIKIALANRVWQNAVRVASLVSIADNPRNPIITDTTMQWSLDLCKACASHMYHEVHEAMQRNDSSNLSLLRSALTLWATGKVLNKYKLTQQEQLLYRESPGIISRRVLTQLMRDNIRGTAKRFYDDLRSEAIGQGLLMFYRGNAYGASGDFFVISRNVLEVC